VAAVVVVGRQRLSPPSSLPSPKLFGEGGNQVGQVMFRLSKPDELIEREIYFAGVGPREHHLGLPEEALGPRELGGRKMFGHVSRAFRRWTLETSSRPGAYLTAAHTAEQPLDARASRRLKLASSHANFIPHATRGDGLVTA
jgi:hypothetical protein